MNSELVKADAYARTGGQADGGFLDIGGTVQEKLNQGMQASQAASQARKSKKAKVDSKINTAMSKMKSNMDLTSLSDNQQKGVRRFLMDQKMKYANAASQIADYRADSPEYMELSDIMQGVNNSFLKLKGNLDAYTENKVEYYDSHKNGLFSAGNDEYDYSLNQGIYDTDSAMSVGDNGNLMFNHEGKMVDYKDVNELHFKDYKSAKTLIDKMASLSKSSKNLNQFQKESLKLEVRSLLNSDPTTAKSLIMDGLLTEGLVGGISEDLLNDPNRHEELVDTLSNVLTEGVANSIVPTPTRGSRPTKTKTATKDTFDPDKIYEVTDAKSYQAMMRALGVKEPGTYLPGYNRKWKIISTVDDKGVETRSLEEAKVETAGTVDASKI